MRILYIANARIPTEKAHGLQIIKMVEAFGLLGHEVELLLPNRRNYLEGDVENFYNLKTQVKIKKLKNIFSSLELVSKNIYFPVQRFFFFWQAFFYTLFSKYDFIFSREATLCFSLQIFGRKAVFEDHEPKNKFRWLYKIFVRSIKKKIIVAKNLEELYEEFGVKNDSYVFTPNGVDLEEINKIEPDRNIWQEKFNISIDEKIVLYVGHFYEWKGVGTLIEAAKLLSNYKIVLIGGVPEDKVEMEKKIKEKGLNNVYLLGYTPHNEVLKFVKSADVLVLPNTAKEERSAKYTTPIKMFDYLASGVPIVASNLPSFKSYLFDRKNCLLFEPDNPGDLSIKIKKILNDMNLAKKISLESYNDVKKYTWEKRSIKILNFIKYEIS
jgi:glycosyltransferase involved in cell wall biosynthesis